MEKYPIRNTSKEYTEEYISLREATKYCSYSGGYLKLRARQGKLKAVKFGRNWVTKKEWVEEYLKKNQKSNIKNQKLTDPMTSKFVFIWKEFFKIRQPRFAFTIGLVFVLLFAGIVFGKDSLKYTFKDLDSLVATLGEKTDLAVEEIFTSLGDISSLGIEGAKIVISDTVNSTQNRTRSVLVSFDEILVGFGQSFASAFSDLKLVKKNFQLMAAEVNKSPIEISKEFFSWLGERLISIPKKIVQGLEKGYNNVYNFTKQKLSELAGIFKPEKMIQKPIVKPTKEAVIVIPSAEKDEEVVQKIKESFSDEVKVEPKDETSGIIIPIFREREGEKYLYILVPIKN